MDGFIVTHPANLHYLCGYTGSNGLLLFLGRRPVFFTDGRYTEQAKTEVAGVRIVIAKGPLLEAAGKLLGFEHGDFVEVQGTAEGTPFRRAELDALLDLAVAGCAELSRIQAEVLAS